MSDLERRTSAYTFHGEEPPPIPTVANVEESSGQRSLWRWRRFDTLAAGLVIGFWVGFAVERWL
jgi:hypothetical protein